MLYIHIPYFSIFKFVGVCSLVGNVSYNVSIVKIEIVFSLNVKDNNICPC